MFAYKVLRPDKDKTFNRADIRPALKRLADERDDTLFVLERIAYFAAQAEWLDTNFPEGVYAMLKVYAKSPIVQKSKCKTSSIQAVMSVWQWKMTE